jgi:hypothetical protein
MAVTFVIGLPDTRPNATHQFVVVTLAVVESTIGLSERIGFLAGGDQVTFGREA